MEVEFKRTEKHQTFFEKGDVFRYNDGLYVVTGREQHVVTAVVVHAGGNATPSGNSTKFDTRTTKVNLVTKLTAEYE